MNCTRIAKSAVVAALVTLSLSQLAFADVILAESDNILGTAQGSKRYDFTVLTPGQYLATLTDLGTPNGWPAPFTDLGMVISEKGGGNPHSLILAAGNSSGTLSFAAIAKTYTLQVIGQPDPNVEHLPGGAFSMQVPLALALTHDRFLYVGDMVRGRIWQVAPDGSVYGLTGVGLDIAVGDAVKPRLQRPAGLAVDADGSLLVADSTGRQVRRLSTHAATTRVEPRAAVLAAATTVPTVPAAPLPPVVAAHPLVPVAASFPWPIAPQDGWHKRARK